MKIEFRDDTEYSESLHHGNTFYLKGNFKSVSYSDIVDVATRIVNNELKAEIQKIHICVG